MKKALFFLFVLVLAIPVGGMFVVRANSDQILEALCAKIEQSSGYPLRMDAMPKIGLFPPKVEMGHTEWGDKEGDMFLSFRHARIGVVLSSLLSGSPDVGSVEFDDLYVHFRQSERPRASAADTATDSAADTTDTEQAGFSFLVRQAHAAPSLQNVSQNSADKVMTLLREKMPASIILRNASFHMVNRKGQTMELTELNAEIHTKNAVSVASPLNFRFLGSAVTGKAHVNMDDPGTASPLINTEISAPGLDLGLLFHILTGQNLAEGHGDLTASLRFHALDVLPTLAGSGQLTSNGLSLKSSALPANLGALPHMENLTKLDSAVVDWTAEKGIVSLGRADVSGPGFTLNTTGTVDLPARQLDVEGNLDIADVAQLPVSLQGPFHKPRYTVKQGSIVNSALQTLQKHGVDEALGQGLDRLMRRF